VARVEKIEDKTNVMRTITLVILVLMTLRRNARKGIGESMHTHGCVCGLLRDVLLPVERLLVTGAPAT